MVKNKASKLEPSSDAYQRINFLIQASEMLKSVTDFDCSIPGYLSNLAKEVAKKIVGKIHPDIKRDFCSACSHPIASKSDSSDVVIKPLKRKRRKGKKKGNVEQSPKELERKKTTPNNKLDRILARRRRPNRISSKCLKCGYLKIQLQRPDHKIWINKVMEEENK